MSTAITKQNSTLMQKPDEDALQIRVALNQNLWGLPDEQVWQYYRSMCSHLRLDPASKPFDIITDPDLRNNGKNASKKLYPNTSCTSQLGDMARLSYGKIEIDVNEGMLKLGFKVAHVAVEVRHPNGRSLVSEAFVDLMSGWEGKPLAGNNLVNALKKAATQCRRRGTLQALGLVAPSDEIPTVKLGDMERTGDEFEGVVIEHPPMTALAAESVTSGNAPAQSESVSPEQAKHQSLLNSVLAICSENKADKAFIKEVNRQLTAFNAKAVQELDYNQLQELNTGISLWFDRQSAAAAA